MSFKDLEKFCTFKHKIPVKKGLQERNSSQKELKAQGCLFLRSKVWMHSKWDLVGDTAMSQ